MIYTLDMAISPFMLLLIPEVAITVGILIAAIIIISIIVRAKKR
jgi:hypothetical protein